MPHVSGNRAVEKDRLNAVAVIEVALDDDTNGIAGGRIDRKHYHRRGNLHRTLRLGTRGHRLILRAGDWR